VMPIVTDGRGICKSLLVFFPAVQFAVRVHLLLLVTGEVPRQADHVVEEHHERTAEHMAGRLLTSLHDLLQVVVHIGNDVDEDEADRRVAVPVRTLADEEHQTVDLLFEGRLELLVLDDVGRVVEEVFELVLAHVMLSLRVLQRSITNAYSSSVQQLGSGQAILRTERAIAIFAIRLESSFQFGLSSTNL